VRVVFLSFVIWRGKEVMRMTETIALLSLLFQVISTIALVVQVIVHVSHHEKSDPWAAEPGGHFFVKLSV